MLLPLVIVPVVLASTGVFGGGHFFSKGSRWSGKETLVCDTNERLVIEDKDVELDDVLIRGRINCKIEIRRSKLRGRTIVDGGMNAEVIVVDSTLVAEETGIIAGANGKVDLAETTVRAGETAVVVGGNGQVKLDGAKVYAEEIAIKGDANATVDARDSRIEGDEAAFDMSVNGKVSLRDTPVKGRRNMGIMGKIHER